jgi:hypothetical protein
MYGYLSVIVKTISMGWNRYHTRNILNDIWGFYSSESSEAAASTLPEDGVSRFLQNVDNYVHDYIVSQQNVCSSLFQCAVRSQSLYVRYWFITWSLVHSLNDGQYNILGCLESIRKVWFWMLHIHFQSSSRNSGWFLKCGLFYR